MSSFTAVAAVSSAFLRTASTSPFSISSVRAGSAILAAFTLAAVAAAAATAVLE